MNGTTVIKGQELAVDASFSDILGHLKFGAMGLVVARKGNWGFGGDAIWMSLDFGYRWLSVDYKTGDGDTLFKYDVTMQGPVLGFVFGF